MEVREDAGKGRKGPEKRTWVRKLMEGGKEGKKDGVLGRKVGKGEGEEKLRENNSCFLPTIPDYPRLSPPILKYPRLSPTISDYP